MTERQRDVSWDNAGATTDTSQWPDYWQRREAASQRALAGVMRENRVRDECLAMAICTLRGTRAETVRQGIADTITTALDGIERRLAELEPEEETG